MNDRVKLVGLEDVMRITTLGKSTVYNYMKIRGFPLPVSIGDRAKAWIEQEVYEWIDKQIAKR